MTAGERDWTPENAGEETGLGDRPVESAKNGLQRVGLHPRYRFANCG